MTTEGVDIIWLSVKIPCPYCPAKPYQWCVTRTSGAEAGYLHSDRTSVIHDAINIGYGYARERVTA